MGKYDFFYINTQGTITLGRPIQVGPAFLPSEQEATAREMHRMLRAAPLLQMALSGLLNCLDDNTADTEECVRAAESALAVARGEDAPGACIEETLDTYRGLHRILSDLVENPDSDARAFFGDRYDEVVSLLAEAAGRDPE